MDGKVVKFPVGWKERQLNQKGNGYVPCSVSARYLMFPNESMGHYEDGEYIRINVMTVTESQDEGKKDKKLCEVIVTREDLLRALNSVQPRRFE